MSLLLNFGGEWDFCFDPEDSGITAKWFVKKPSRTRKVTIPHVWDMESDKGSSHAAFYFKKFVIDKSESSKRFFIRFENVFNKRPALFHLLRNFRTQIDFHILINYLPNLIYLQWIS